MKGIKEMHDLSIKKPSGIKKIINVFINLLLKPKFQEKKNDRID
jgi:hypothetical protein